MSEAVEAPTQATVVDKDALLSKSLDDLGADKKQNKGGKGRKVPLEKLDMSLDQISNSAGPARRGNSRNERKPNPTGSKGGSKGAKGSGKGKGKGKGNGKGDYGGKGPGNGGKGKGSVPSSTKYKAREVMLPSFSFNS
jgi:hypothetical protein